MHIFKNHIFHVVISIVIRGDTNLVFFKQERYFFFFTQINDQVIFMKILIYQKQKFNE